MGEWGRVEQQLTGGRLTAQGRLSAYQGIAAFTALLGEKGWLQRSAVSRNITDCRGPPNVPRPLTPRHHHHHTTQQCNTAASTLLLLLLPLSLLSPPSGQPIHCSPTALVYCSGPMS